jgi:hypothetical protein
MRCVVVSKSPINISIGVVGRAPVLFLATCESNYWLVPPNFTLGNLSMPFLSSLIAPSVLLSSTGAGQIATTAGAFVFVLGNKDCGSCETEYPLSPWHRSFLGNVGTEVDADVENVRLEVRFGIILSLSLSFSLSLSLSLLFSLTPLRMMRHHDSIVGGVSPSFQLLVNSDPRYDVSFLVNN